MHFAANNCISSILFGGIILSAYFACSKSLKNIYMPFKITANARVLALFYFSFKALTRFFISFKAILILCIRNTSETARNTIFYNSTASDASSMASLASSIASLVSSMASDVSSMASRTSSMASRVFSMAINVSSANILARQISILSSSISAMGFIMENLFINP